MKLIMHILKKSNKLGIDNETLDSWEIRKKLSEEYREVCEAISEYNYDKSQDKLKEVIIETFDLIQMCILILWRCHRVAKEQYKDSELIKDINIEHKDKLIVERGWEPLTGIRIEVKE